MSRRSLTRLLGSALGIAVLCAALFALWPVQLGGWTGYAVIKGNSMEPDLHTGDLVVTRKHGSYEVGDAVLYHSPLLDANVYHRIVAAEGGRFTFRGDNRTENDPEALGADRIRGAEWLVIPGVGAALTWVGQPVNLAIALFVLVLLILLGGREVARRRSPRPPVPVHAEPAPRESSSAVTAAARAVAVAGAIGAVLFGALMLLGWSRDATLTRTVVGGYAHTGTFAYEADARRGVAYPDGVVPTGQPVFATLSDDVDVTFDYAFVSDEKHDVRGSIALDVRIDDETTGWTRTLPLVTAAPFDGSSATVEGVLDLDRLQGIVQRFGTSTGTNVTTAQVVIVPRVDVAGYAGQTVIDEPFAPELPFVLDQAGLRLVEEPARAAEAQDGSEPAVSPLTPRSEGSGTTEVPAAIELGPVAVAVDTARSAGTIGLVVSLLALLGGTALLLTRLRGTERERIEALFGGRVVGARAIVPDGRWITEVNEIDELVRIADAYDRVVLRVEEDGGDTYLVDDGIAVYRWRSAAQGTLGAPRTLPAHGR